MSEDIIIEVPTEVITIEMTPEGKDGQDGFSPIAAVSKSGKTATITITDKTGTTTASVTDGEDGQPGPPGTTTWEGITDKPESFPPSAHTHTVTDITDFPTLGTMSAESASDYYTKSATDALLSEKADIIHTSASCSLVHITDAAAMPVESLTVGIEPVQDLIVPTGYQILEYIESYGNSYINTGFIPTTDDGFEIDFSSTNLIDPNNYGCVLGGRTNSNYNDFQFTTYVHTDSIGVRMGTLRWGNGGGDGAGMLAPGTRGKAKLYQKTYTAPDGTVTTITDVRTGEYPLYVFALNNAGTPTQQGGGTVRIYSLKLYRGANVAMDFVPVKSPDNKYGLFDLVGKKFYPPTAMKSGTQPSGGGTNVLVPSPEHQCPISGHTQAVISNSATAWECVQGGIYDADGMDSNATNRIKTDFIPIDKLPEIITLNDISKVNQLRFIYFYDASKNFISTSEGMVYQRNLPAEIEITLPTGCAYFRMVFINSLNADITAEGLYAIADPTSVTINLGDERYGGNLDVTTGVLTVVWQLDKIKDLNWDYNPNVTNRFYSNTLRTIIKLPTTAVERAAFVKSDIYHSSNDVISQYADTNVNNAIATYSDGYIYIIDRNYTSASDFKTARGEVQICYLLAEPFTVQLTPAELSLFYGDNNVWADTGDTIVGYRADTKLYIDRKIAELQALILDN